MDGELSVLWRVRKTVNAMLLSRGYVLSSADLELDVDDFRARFGDPGRPARRRDRADRHRR